MRILLSIRPQYADQIFSGSKRFEFRKAVHKNPAVNTIVVYATKPVGKVIGEFTVSDIHFDSPKQLWRRTKAHSGISKVFFQEYFAGRKRGYAIEISKARLYPKPLELQEVSPKGFAPQSFLYLPAFVEGERILDSSPTRNERAGCQDSATKQPFM